MVGLKRQKKIPTKERSGNRNKMDITHKLYFKFNEPLINWLIKLKITANQLSIFNIFLMLFGVCGLLIMRWNWLALCLIAVSVIIDYADGDLAKKTKTVGEAGIWLDTYTDIIMQNSVMGAIAIGNNVPVWLVVIFFISNLTLNIVGLQYNAIFGFDSYKGNSLFRKYMDEKPTFINKFFKELIDPTDNFISLVLYTIRYWIVAGIICNNLLFVFIIITSLTLLRAVCMYMIFTLYLLDCKKLWVLLALKLLDERKEEFYQCRNGK